MVYDDMGSDPVYFRNLDLPMPNLQELASGPEETPSEEIRELVLATARKGDGEVNPYWLHAEVQQTRRDVTIGQVARILLDAGW